MQTLWISKDPCISEEKDKLIKRKGGGASVCLEGLQVINVEKDGGRERVPVPRSHEDHVNVMANEVVQHFSNLTAKGCWESAYRVLRAEHALGGITDYNSSEHIA